MPTAFPDSPAGRSRSTPNPHNLGESQKSSLTPPPSRIDIDCPFSVGPIIEIEGDGRTFLVGDHGAASIRRLRSDGTELAEIPLGIRIDAAAPGENGTFWGVPWVGEDDNETIRRFDKASGAEILADRIEFDAFRITQFGGTIFAYKAGFITPINASTKVAGTPVACSDRIVAMAAISAAQSRVLYYKPEGLGNIWLATLSHATGELTDIAPAPRHAEQLAVDADGNAWCATNFSPNTLTIEGERRVKRISLKDRAINFGLHAQMSVGTEERGLLVNMARLDYGIGLNANAAADEVTLRVSDSLVEEPLELTVEADLVGGCSVFAVYDPAAHEVAVYVDGELADTLDVSTIDMRAVTPAGKWAMGSLTCSWPTAASAADMFVRGAIAQTSESPWTAQQVAVAHRNVDAFATQLGPNSQLEHICRGDQVAELSTILTDVSWFSRDGLSGFVANRFASVK